MTFGTTDGINDPVSIVYHDALTGEDGLIAQGGGLLRLPPKAGIVELRGISYYQPEGITSAVNIIHVNISIRTCRSCVCASCFYA